MKVVINACFGGWSMSEEAGNELGIVFKPTVLSNGAVLNSPMWRSVSLYQLEEKGYSRTHPKVVEVVERMGEKASGCFSKLTVIDIPDDVEWEVEEYDGYERIDEVHRTWSV